MISHQYGFARGILCLDMIYYCPMLFYYRGLCFKRYNVGPLSIYYLKKIILVSALGNTVIPYNIKPVIFKKCCGHCRHKRVYEGRDMIPLKLPVLSKHGAAAPLQRRGTYHKFHKSILLVFFLLITERPQS